MSDLHDLSAPIEGQITQKPPEKPVKPDFSKLTNYLKSLQIKYGKKLLISLGISISIVSLIIVLLHISQPAIVVAPDEETVVDQTPEQVPPEDTGVKFTRFDGNQYFFYFPDNYSFLNRNTSNNLSTLNWVTFSNEDDSHKFYLQEFLYLNPTQERLDSIYGGLKPSPEEEISTGQITNSGNTFEKRIYDCTAEQIQNVNNDCDDKQVIYTIEINGLLIVFINWTIPEEEFENTILNTFVKNIIDSDNLSETYVISNIPRIKNRIDAHMLLGVPKNIGQLEPCESCKKELVYQLRDSMEVILVFNETDTLVDTLGRYAQFEFDLADAVANPDAAISPQEAHDRVVNNSGIRKNVLNQNPDALIYLEEDSIDSTYWHIIIYGDEDMTVTLGEYWISKDKGAFRPVDDTGL